MCKYCERNFNERTVYSLKNLGDLKPNMETGQGLVTVMMVHSEHRKVEDSGTWLRIVRHPYDIEKASTDTLTIPIYYCPFCGEKL